MHTHIYLYTDTHTNSYLIVKKMYLEKLSDLISHTGNPSGGDKTQPSSKGFAEPPSPYFPNQPTVCLLSHHSRKQLSLKSSVTSMLLIPIDINRLFFSLY